MSEAIFGALGVTIVASAIWLTVRIVNRRERWAKRTAVVLTLVLAYPMSVGPVLWMDVHGLTPAWMQDVPIYAPIQWLRENGPEPTRELIKRYLAFWIR